MSYIVTRASGGMADALASGASVLRDVGVQVPLRPQQAVEQTALPEVANPKGNVTSGFFRFLVCKSQGLQVRRFEQIVLNLHACLLLIFMSALL